MQKLKATLKEPKLLILPYIFGPRAQKWPKITKKTLHSFATCSNFFYRCDIFWMVSGASSCLGGSEYVCHRGVESVLGWVGVAEVYPNLKKKMKNAVSHGWKSAKSFQDRAYPPKCIAYIARVSKEEVFQFLWNTNFQSLRYAEQQLEFKLKIWWSTLLWSIIDRIHKIKNHLVSMVSH